MSFKNFEYFQLILHGQAILMEPSLDYFIKIDFTIIEPKYQSKFRRAMGIVSLSERKDINYLKRLFVKTLWLTDNRVPIRVIARALNMSPQMSIF